jgi:hypothetical protein
VAGASGGSIWTKKKAALGVCSETRGIGFEIGAFSRFMGEWDFQQLGLH